MRYVYLTKRWMDHFVTTGVLDADLQDGVDLTAPSPGTTWSSFQLKLQAGKARSSKKLCLKSDGEPARVAIQEEVRRQRIDETLLDNSLVGDRRPNGISERAVQSVAEQIRVLRAALEATLKAKVPGNHPVTCWLIEHSANVVNKYQKGDDGRTAYHRLRGKSWNHDMVEFGEKVHYSNSTVDGARSTSCV